MPASESNTSWHPKVGLVVGLAMGAGIYYYKQIVAASDARGKTPNLILAHADFKKVLRHLQADEPHLLCGYLEGIVERLSYAGCDVAAVTAVAPHICIRSLKARSSIPFIDMIESIRSELHRRGARRISIIGSRFVMESNLFGALDSVVCIKPSPEDLDVIAEMYLKIGARGYGEAKEFRAICGIAERLYLNENLDIILIAGTDLSELFNSFPCPFPFLDAAGVQIADIVERLLTDA